MIDVPQMCRIPVFQEMSYPCTRTHIVPALVSVQLSILVDYDFMFWFQQIFKHIEVGIIYIYTQI